MFSSDHLVRQVGDVGIVLHRLADRFGGMGEIAILGRLVELLLELAFCRPAPWSRRWPAPWSWNRARAGLFLHHRLGAAGMGAVLAHHLAAHYTPPDPDTVWAMDWGAK